MLYWIDLGTFVQVHQQVVSDGMVCIHRIDNIKELQKNYQEEQVILVSLEVVPMQIQVWLVPAQQAGEKVL